ncbi:MAG: VOC family protein [Gammaproteobacteria bacterium]|nr:VOC family protein [Gammaproteobacteria bacterium]MDH5730338.1 VOC family protein [Gammaproteobacteria bacterium]
MELAKNPNVAVWFEIPALDLQRAKTFYQEVFAVELTPEQMGDFKLELFPDPSNDETRIVSGALVKGEGYQPNANGSVVYLNGGKDLDKPLSKIEKNGGKVLIPKTHLGEAIGFIALFSDTEGNRLGLHSKH